MERRRLLQAGAATALFSATHAVAKGFGIAPLQPKLEILDAHIHLFDPGRPGGIPWPEPGDPIYKAALPDRFERVSSSIGVVGAIAIEASPLPEDNDWVLSVIQQNTGMVGMVGDLIPGSSQYGQQLERLHRNPLFLGIRYGNLWKRNLAMDWKRAGFVADLKLLAQGGLVFETANPDPDLVGALLAIAERVPDLTIVVDHLPNSQIPLATQARRDFFSQVAALGRAPRIYSKLSEVLEKPGNDGSAGGKSYTEKLDRLWDAFGSDKVLFGSDWPNSDHLATYAETFAVVHTYLLSKGPEACRKFFFANSQRAYRWQPRRANQRQG